MKKEMSFEDFEKAKKGDIKKSMKKGPINHMHVEKLDNGYMTTYHHEAPVSGNKSMLMDMDALRSKHFHKTPEEMGAHHSMMMGGRQLIPEGQEAEDESKAAGAGDTNKET